MLRLCTADSFHPLYSASARIDVELIAWRACRTARADGVVRVSEAVECCTPSYPAHLVGHLHRPIALHLSQAQPRWELLEFLPPMWVNLHDQF